MIEVTQADREAAASCLPGAFWARIIKGQMDTHPIVQALAAHRIAAEKAQRERDAVIADDVERLQENDNGDANTGGAAQAAQAIRSAP